MRYQRGVGGWVADQLVPPVAFSIEQAIDIERAANAVDVIYF